MAFGSPTVDTSRSLIFGEDSEDTEALENEWLASSNGTVGDSNRETRRESMYVTLFEDMLKTVIRHESHLFSFHEITCLKDYRSLSASARYLLIRLCLRKTDKWHRFSSLKYEGELGNTILPAIQELCRTNTRRTKTDEPKIKMEEPDVIDLTFDDDQPVAGPSKLPPPSPIPPPPTLPNYGVFADDASKATTRELLECLTVPELKTIEGKMKVKRATGTQSNIIDSLLDASAKQSTLSFPTISRAKGNKKDTSLHQTRLPFLSAQRRRTQQDRLREVVLETLGQCIRVNEEVVKLFRRFNLVYFRSTEYSPTLIIPAILVRAKKRTYPAYTYTRTSKIWPSRSVLIEYEEALELSAEMDELLSGTTFPARGRSRTVAGKTPASVGRSITVSPSKSPRKRARMDEENDSVELAPAESPRITAAKAARDILEKVYPKWLDLVKTEDEENHSNPLERFDCGHILTRLICKGAYALSVLKDYDSELMVLGSLLAQKRWRRARRGRWHERRALILQTHMGKDVIKLTEAMNAVVTGLEDEDTHMVFRPALERRLTRLEKKLAVPSEERHVCNAVLEKAEETFVSGVRIEHKSDTLMLDSSLKVANKPSSSSSVQKQAHLRFISQVVMDKPDVVLPVKSTGKSIWRGRDGDEITVESFALQYYENLGYKGFHCEGRIVTTLFGFLFWDIIFAPIPGAFETPFQSAPLDIAEDTFYTSRQDLADRRLKEIEVGQAPSILESVYDEHCERKTMCVGVRWDMFEKQDLLEIARCIHGRGLSAICRLLCEDYASRCSGVPDLIIWNAEHEDCKFVEVKGPGDRLQENQKVWIDVLLQAGVPVHVCHVEEEGMEKKGKKTPKGKKKTTTTPGRKRKRAAETESDPEQEEAANMVESEDEDALPLIFKATIDDPDVLPSISILNTMASSSTLSSRTTRTPRRMASRVEDIPSTPPPGKKLRLQPPSSP